METHPPTSEQPQPTRASAEAAIGSPAARFRGPSRAGRTARLPGAAGAVDARALASDLSRAIEGEVRFDDGTRALYATDASNYRQVPIGVVIPRSIDDVVETVRVCRQHGAPVLSRGGGTSLAGQCCNVAVVIAWQKHLQKILDLDAATRTARVWPGTILDKIRDAAEVHHLTFGPDPATHDHCAIGGMIGNNACGAHAQMAGPVSHNVLALEVLTYDGVRMRVGKTSEEELQRIIAEGGRRGEIYRAMRDIRDRYGDEVRRRFPKIPRRISGFNLDALLPENGFDVARALVGTEGTCVTVLEATLKLVHSPPHRVIVLLGYPSVADAGDVAAGLAQRFRPLALEGLDGKLIRNVTLEGEHAHRASLQLRSEHERFLPLLPPGESYLMIELGGETREEASDRAREMMDAVRRGEHPPSMRLYEDRESVEHVWKIRESGLGATARVPGKKDTWPGWEDSAVPPERLGDYLRGLEHLYQKYGFDASLYGHFGQACVHTRIDFDLRSEGGVRQFRSFLEEASDLCLSMGGSLSGEHGDGVSRAELLPKMFGDDLVRGFREFKRVWDPEGKMNPGKVVDPEPIVSNLRLRAREQPWIPETRFKFPDDGNFLHATERCVGVGKCRREGGGTMCPSYMVTLDEKHTTRGRAHALFEMMQGDPIRKGWRDDAVKETLDLCLSCKGCKGECPVNVDMATYKAEFLSHYYRGRLRPRAAYSMGLVMFWAPLAMAAPRAVNFLTRTTPFKQALQVLGGIARERDMPRFAPQTFQRWFRRRPPPARTPARGRVLLWPDTFNNHFFPETAAAALDVLEDAGFEVVVPTERVCCGRPLFDFGMIPTAQRMLRRTMRVLRPWVEQAVPIVGLEPSCVSVFRDELRGLFPDDPLARSITGQTFLLSELLDRRAKDWSPPRLDGAKAVVHGHCHHKSLFRMDAEKALLKRMGLEVEIPETGCCGMAGAFGFEAGEKYDVSVRVGERVLLPKVREAPRRTLVVADGFSCREMIAQHTERHGLHLAQVIRMAMAEGIAPGAKKEPEKGWVTSGIGARPPRTVLRRVGVAAATLVAGAAVAAPALARVTRARRAARAVERAAGAARPLLLLAAASGIALAAIGAARS